VTDPPDTAGELTGSTSTGVDPRLSALLCYLAWWVSGVVFLVIEQEHRGVRFHAAQSTVLFGGLSMLIVLLAAASVAALFISPAAFQATRMVVYLVWFGAVLLWLVVLLKTFRGESWRVPLAGDLAARLAARPSSGA
jgi:uncharacterized membrane protein